MRTALVMLVAGSLTSLALAQTTQLLPSMPQEDGDFGAAVAGVKVGAGATLRDNAAVGSPREDLPGGFFDAGRVRIYNSETGALLRTIEPPNKQPGGEFGRAIAGLDRINAGENGEVLVGAPMQRPGVQPEVIAAYGRAYIFDGSTGQMLRAIKSPTQQSFSFFGWAVASLGDLNADGYTDYAISAPGEIFQVVPQPGQPVGFPKSRVGRVHVFNGQTGALMRTLLAPQTTPSMVTASAANPEGHLNFGYSVAAVPDITGDGKADIAVGAPQDSTGAGRVYLYNSVSGALVRTLQRPASLSGHGFGRSIAGMGDVSGDGRGEVVVGAPGDYATPKGQLIPGPQGRVYIYSGGNGALVRTFTPVLSGIQGSGFGVNVATVPDATGDNKPDVIVSAAGDLSQGFMQAGQVYVFNGVTGARSTLISPHAELGGRFGEAIAGLRMPGRDRVLAGAIWEDPGYALRNSGRAYILQVLFGNPVMPIFP